MDPQFWHERWHENRIGFHQSDVNRFLQRHADQLGPPGRVFVPLCGKSHDMRWLRAQGHEVLGCELSPLAVEAFYQEWRKVAERSGREEFLAYEADGVSILLGDYFHLTGALLGPITAVYDRAALIAMPPAKRPDYAQQMAALVRPGTPVLLIAPFSLKDPASGPPFAVSGEEIAALFGPAFHVERLACERETADTHPELAERGLAWREESVYRLTRR